MSGRPPCYTAELADRILRELARGRSMRNICAEPDMPCDKTVRQWAADDIDGFAARYRAARATGAALLAYPTRYTAEIAERFLGQVTSGRTLTELYREPGMPNRSTIRKWLADNREDFSRHYRQAREIGRALNGGRIAYSAEVVDRVLGELMEGRTLAELCDDFGMPSKATVQRWARQDRDGFAARYREAREIGGHIMIDQIITIGDDGRHDLVWRRTKSGATEVVVDHMNIYRARLRCENRRRILWRSLPRTYRGRLKASAGPDGGDGGGERSRARDGTRGVRSEDETADEA